jgi:hypothetical protein
MKLTTIALATALAVSSTAALAQGAAQGQGTVTAPSVGSYTGTVGTTNVPRTWNNTNPAAPPPSSTTSAPMPSPSPMTSSGISK